ncbi:mechanosensitive ion channel family protein [Shewanella sp. NIFS-20-20]|uniref:mechanosensitive ion channel family protein n=1 Tax=Shewanella sp. NIFS-20-20 TaxID=2853806 RepID=UPI001C44ADE3|nr:mechanosensitive ion channel family protein [Shewanella sp. NIFS-20-20]MBV7314405.1 mechanosensitive ion channel [Shewanella sp. NIFS-20-20]
MNKLTVVMLMLCLAGSLLPSVSANALLVPPTSEKSLPTVEKTLEEVAGFNYQDPLTRDTPRGAIRGLANAVSAGDYETATQYLDLRYLPAGMDASQGPEYVRMLKAIYERHMQLDIYGLVEERDGLLNDNLPTFRELIGRFDHDGQSVSLLLQRVPEPGIGKVWKISNATVAKLPELYHELGYSPLVEWLIDKLPEGKFAKLNYWEWALLVIYSVAALLITVPCCWIIAFVVKRGQSPLALEWAYFISWPLCAFIAVTLNRVWLSNTSATVMMQKFVDTGLLFMLTILWLLWSGIGLIQASLRLKMLANGKKQAASLVRPLFNLARVIAVLLGLLVWLEYLGFDAGAILAGMGIGGIAIALASKQTIENFIGTITLYSAAPLKVGNLCNLGGLKGTVEEIGLRCTRVRTVDRSVIHIPNSKLAEMEIENISEREKIRFKTDVRLAYTTQAEQVNAIIEEITQLLVDHDDIDESPLRVTFKGFGLAGLEINVFAYVATTSLPTYQRVAQELQLGIMTIVEKHGSRIVPAVPTIATA